VPTIAVSLGRKKERERPPSRKRADIPARGRRENVISVFSVPASEKIKKKGEGGVVSALSSFSGRRGEKASRLCPRRKKKEKEKEKNETRLLSTRPPWA